MLEATFLRFTHYMSKWRPPGRGARGVCGLCGGIYQFIAEMPVIRDLPHEVTHVLVREVHSAYDRLYQELVDQEEAERAAQDRVDLELPHERHDRLVELAQRAEDDLIEALGEHLDEIEHVRVRYIEPRIEQYVRFVVESVTSGDMPPEAGGRHRRE